MVAPRDINITLEVFGILISFIIIICLLAGTDRNSKLTRLFMRIVLCTMAALICDAIAWTYDGGASSFAYFIVRITKFMAYSLSYLLIPLLTDYIVALIERNVKLSKNIVHVMYALCAIAILLVAICQFNHIYYDFDENNMYRVREMFWLSQVLGILYLSIDTVAILKYWKNMSRSEMLFLLSYAIFPLLAMIIQIFIWKEFEFMFIAVTLSIVTVYGGIQAQQAKQLKQKELELTQSQIAVMLSQIQPHFLYNSLTAIGKLCDINPKNAKIAVTDFADYLRGNLDSVGKRKLIYFEDELDHVEAYLSLERLRYKERLRVVIEAPVMDFIIPPLTVQPLVENAVQHGLMRKKEGGTVCIRTERTEYDVRITVADDGVGYDINEKKDDGRTHVGIENVREMINIMCGGTLEITSTLGLGTTAVIIIPRNMEEKL